MERVNIDTRGLMPAEIDEKNIMSDAIFESIFDDGLYTEERREAMGFICGYPSYAVIFGKCLEVRPITDNSKFHFSTLATAAVDRLTASHSILPLRLTENDKTFQYISDDAEPEQRYIITFSVSKKKVFASYHWNVPRT